MIGRRIEKEEEEENEVKSFLENVNLTVLNDIFKEFLNKITIIGLDFNQLDSIKDHFVYHYLGIPYRATCYVDRFSGKDNLNIKLCNHELLCLRNKERHKSNQCNDFMDEAMPDIKKFLQKFLGNDCKFYFYYNEQHQQVDIKTFSKNNDSNKGKKYQGIVISFEFKFPSRDYDIESADV